MKKILIPFLLGLCLLGVNPLFAQEVLDGVYIKEHTPTRKPIPYTHLRNADVMWSKRIWREIDLRQKINHPFYFPDEPISGRKSLFDVIKEGIKEGTITAYNGPADDEFSVPLTKDDAEKMFSRLDTQYVDNPETGEMEMKVVAENLSSSDIKKYRLKEEWFFDKQKSVLEVRIIGMQLIKIKKDENGNFRSYEGLFWIYYPQARYVFAMAEVFNRSNDAERLTYEDLFWKRMFGSYIYKESNVYNRLIIDYTKGMEAQLEAERIKEEIFNYEHDLWHY